MQKSDRSQREKEIGESYFFINMKIVPYYHDDIDELSSNSYVIEDGKNCLFIDPSKENGELLRYIRKHNLILKGILITHGHVDHIRGIKSILAEIKVPIFIHFCDADKLKDTSLNCSSLVGESIIIDEEPILLVDGQVIDCLEEPIRVMETPYHTSGSVCYLLKKSSCLFSGDSLFKNGYGRYDLPTGDRNMFKSSISKILSLPEDIVVYPGHGMTTTIKEEKTRF